MNFRFFRRILLFLLLGTVAPIAAAMEYLAFRENGEVRKKAGRMLLEAGDGLVFEARDGRYFIIPPDQVVSRTSDETPFTPLTKKEMIERLKREFPESEGYHLYEREHFLIVHTTSRAFAQWYGQLLEKLYTGFIGFWRGKGVPLDRLDRPMVAVVYSNRDQFFRHAVSEGVTPNRQLCAYYNKLTNRVVMCDLSGIETYRAGEKDRASSRDIQAFLNQPDAAYNIAMVVHEATHQIGFNCGLHARFAPYPLWVCEGIALFHEVPDRDKKGGWSIKPKPNDLRLNDLKRYLSKSPRDPLQTMIRSDKVLQDPATALEHYAMAWGLTYYLIMKRPKEFAAYLRNLAEKTPLSEDSPEIRIREFEECFGDDWGKLYKNCGAYLERL